MKNWCSKLFLSIAILLNGFGNVYAHCTPSTPSNSASSLIFKTDFNYVHLIKQGRTFETFKRKICLFDNEENEENFSSVEKQIVKTNYFLIFHCNNQFAVSTTAFTKKVNDCKIFSLLDNKVYLLFQVFRI